MKPETVTLEPESGKLCERPGCLNLVEEGWDHGGRLCPSCSLAFFLYDREARWDELAMEAADAELLTVKHA